MPKTKVTDLEKYREDLGLLGRLQIDEKLAGKVDVSGVVQMTLLEASETEWAALSDEARVPWLRRIFALRPILLTLLVSCCIILEMRLDWVERTLGTYLVTTNSARPETGAVWEKGHRTRTAQRNLEKIITDRQTSQREARRAETFSQIAASLTTGQGAMLSAERFRPPSDTIFYF